MRRARITFEGAFHHVMNRGLDGNSIFHSDEMKRQFIQLLGKNKKKHRSRILAYCVMNNHYQLVLQNNNGKMSAFQKDLNGQFGSLYRKFRGGIGYVFQGRFKSTLVQEDAYLMTALRYVLQNPIRAKIVESVKEYPWSSLIEIEKTVKEPIIDKDFIQGIIGDKEDFISELDVKLEQDLPITKSRWGNILGTKTFIETSILKFNRRKKSHPTKMGRIDDGWFQPLEMVVQEFEKKYGIDIHHMRCHSWEKKRIRGELLVRLKDLCGLTYREIKEFPVFNDLKLNSMAKLYRDTLARLESKTK
jgi:REP element-mobilizing transposase RayT